MEEREEVGEEDKTLELEGREVLEAQLEEVVEEVQEVLIQVEMEEMGDQQ